MTRTAIVLRPEPGNSATATRLRAAGLNVIQMPLFTVVPLAWTRPEGEFDALLLTSANAVRHGGEGLASVGALPVIAVGTATASAARAAGFIVAAQGVGDGAAAGDLARGLGFPRLLRLAGQDRAKTGSDVITVSVYAARALAIEPAAIRPCIGCVALLHSARAATRFTELVSIAAIGRSTIRIAAISPTVLEAAGKGWGESLAAAVPSDEAIIAITRTLAD